MKDKTRCFEEFANSTCFSKMGRLPSQSKLQLQYYIKWVRKLNLLNSRLYTILETISNFFYFEYSLGRFVHSDHYNFSGNSSNVRRD